MPITTRWSGLRNPSPDGPSLEETLRATVRGAIATCAVVLAAGLALQVAAAARLDSVVTGAYPELLDARILSSTLAAVRVELADANRSGIRVARLDSLADRFHAIARHSRGVTGDAAFRALDGAFTEYLAAARPAVPPAGTLDVLVPGAAQGDQLYGELAGMLASRSAAAERAVDAGLAAAHRLQRLVLLAMSIAGVAALSLLAILGMLATRAASRWSARLVRHVDALAAGNAELIATPSGAGARVDAALRRLSRQLQDNAEMARALADGAVHRAARAGERSDPVSVALAAVASTMRGLAASATRIARGDLAAVVEPRSPHDHFGRAHAAMTQRIVATLRDADVMRRGIEGIVTTMRGDAAALASSANVDADRLRRAEERLACVTLQARADAARSAELAERASESDVMLDQGSMALQSSLDGVSEVLRRSAGVQRLARSAGLLAVRATSRRVLPDADAVPDDEARALAADAAAAARAITRVMIDGSEQTHAAGVAFDRVALAAREGSALVRELGLASHRQARSLGEIDDTVSHVQRTTARSADTARQLLHRLDALSSHARRLDTVLRRFDRGRGTAISAVQVLGADPSRGSAATPRTAALAM